jgi:hypothetical protein
MNAIRRTAALMAGLVLAVMLGGCGGDPPPPPPPPPATPTPPPPPSVVTSGQGPLEFDALVRVPFDTTRAGSIDVTVNWTDPANSLLVIVTNGACSFDQLLADQCPRISTSFISAPKPRTISLASRPAGPYTLFIGNLGPGDESISYQVVLSPTAASTAAARPAVSAGSLDLKRFKRHVELP